MHLVSISKLPTLSSGIHFRVPTIPPASLSIFLHVSSCIFISFQCLGFTPHLSTTFCAHPVSISNFPFPLCARQFPASISLHTQASPNGLSTTSYVFIVSIPEHPRHQQLLAFILSQYLNSPHPVPGPKKRVRVPKKKAPRPKNIQPNVSAYKNGVSPHPMEARSTKQVHGSKKQKPSSETINLAVEKKLWVQHKHMQVQKKYPHRVQKTHKQVPHIFCDSRSKKKSG